MKREVNIAAYWPWVVGETQEFRVLSAVESPELTEAWDATDLVLINQFLFDATEYGVGRWETMLGIIPEADDTLDARKWRIYLRMNDSLPYTYRVLLERLRDLCGEGKYEVHLYPDRYLVLVKVAVDSETQHEVIAEYLRERMLPANILLDCRSTDTWGEIMGLLTWTEYAQQTWGDVLGLFLWEQYQTLTWGDLKDRTWGEVLGTTTWGKILGEKTWGEIKAENETWNDVYHYRGGEI